MQNEKYQDYERRFLILHRVITWTSARSREACFSSPNRRASLQATKERSGLKSLGGKPSTKLWYPCRVPPPGFHLFLLYHFVAAPFTTGQRNCQFKACIPPRNTNTSKTTYFKNLYNAVKSRTQNKHLPFIHTLSEKHWKLTCQFLFHNIMINNLILFACTSKETWAQIIKF